MIDLPASSFVLPIILLCALCILTLVALVLKDVLREQGRPCLTAVVGEEDRIAANAPRMERISQRYARIRRFGKTVAMAYEKSPLQMR